MNAPTSPRVLLVLEGPATPRDALLRAVALAGARDATLHVLRVLPMHLGTFPLFPHVLAGAALATMRDAVEATERTRRWLEETVPPSVARPSLEVMPGDLETLVVERARALAAELVVLPDLGASVGHLATRLARAVQRPVLVARPAQATDVIVAASDLRDPDYPVVRAASALARRLEAEVVALHNVPPAPIATTPALPVVLERTASLASQRRAELEALTRSLPVPAEACVSRQVFDDAAIVREALARRADLVVVGLRPRTFWQRLFGRSVAAQVVERAAPSVLVLPIAAP